MPPEALANSSPTRWLPSPMPCCSPAKPAAREELRRRLAALPGPIVPLIVAGADGYDWTRLVSERTITINTTASGGNASLLSLTETPG